MKLLQIPSFLNLSSGNKTDQLVNTGHQPRQQVNHRVMASLLAVGRIGSGETWTGSQKVGVSHWDACDTCTNLERRSCSEQVEGAGLKPRLPIKFNKVADRQ